MKKIIIFLALIISGCTTHQSMPVEKTNYCTKSETVNCRPRTPAEITGPGSRRHSDDKPKYQLYVPPEEIWPDEYLTAPRVCASPFRGSILQR
jgi:hypothetical protein